MQSPPAEWAMLIGHGVILDYIRDRGEPDGDTLSEVIRNLFHVDTPHGRIGLAATIAGSGILLYRHLAKDST